MRAHVWRAQHDSLDVAGFVAGWDHDGNRFLRRRVDGAARARDHEHRECQLRDQRA